MHDNLCRSCRCFRGPTRTVTEAPYVPASGVHAAILEWESKADGRGKDCTSRCWVWRGGIGALFRGCQGTHECALPPMCSNHISPRQQAGIMRFSILDSRFSIFDFLHSTISFSPAHSLFSLFALVSGSPFSPERLSCVMAMIHAMVTSVWMKLEAADDED